MILLATAYRRLLPGRWEWMMAIGVIDLILAGIVILGLPGTPACQYRLKFRRARKAARSRRG
jgi:uncharacterized membrane protein HdeD (DUF308 family)